MSESHKREAAIFDAAAGLPPEQRAAYLDQACGDDAALRQRMESLLKAGESRCDFLDPAPDPELRPTVHLTVPLSEKPGDRIGPYRLLQRIGEGGYGAVYVAEQAEPIHRRVALKILKLGMDTRSVIARFEAERQALALMDHPNIAKVFDAGATETGRPYFVMELVRGVKITDYCDEKNLPMRERLNLFIRVCQAIQHAHQKGIIHRDIKPSNILVTVNDGVAVPKIIDFGIAKATSGQLLTDKTIYTAFEQFIGTPAYMSPEQAMLTSLDIDTRSDIYALGVLLYELLTGRTPFDPKELLEIGLDEMRRTIREAEPPRPSTRVSTLPGKELSTMAQRRGLEAPKLLSELRGDLDWIVMKCLEKDRARRYETATGLATDVQRHLDDEPVAARPPSRLYRFERMVRRNKLAFTVAAAIVAALALGLGVSTWSFLKEKKSRQQAAVARQQAEANLFTAREAIDRMYTRAADELAGRPHMEQLRRNLLEDALQFYEGFLRQKPNDPDVQHGAALAYLRVGGIYHRLGHFDKCVQPLEEGIARLESLSRGHPLDLRDREEIIAARGALAYAKMWLYAEIGPALAERQKVLELHEELRREFPTVPAYLTAVARTECGIGNILRQANRQEEATGHFRRALALYEQHRRDFPAEPEDRDLLAQIQLWRGALLQEMHRFDEAEHSLRIAHELREQLLAEQPDDVWFKQELITVNRYLAYLLTGTGRLQEGLELLEAAVPLQAELMEGFSDLEDCRRASHTFDLLGHVLAASGRPEDAEAAFRRAVTIREKLVADAPALPVHADNLAGSYNSLGVFLELRGESGEAAEFFRKARGLWEELVIPPPKTRTCERNLAWMLVTCPQVAFRDPGRALELTGRSMRSEGETARHWMLLGTAQYRAGDLAGAIESLHKSMKIAGGGDAQQWLVLSMIYVSQGDRVQAREWYDKAVAWIEEVHPSGLAYARWRAEAAELMEAAR